MTPFELISAYQEAWKASNKASKIPGISYSRGWFTFSYALNMAPYHYRRKQMEQMLNNLRERQAERSKKTA